MKRENQALANAICQDLQKFERIAGIAESATCKVTVWISGNGSGDTQVIIPVDHAKFLKRVVKDHYRDLVSKLNQRLESL